MYYHKNRIYINKECKILLDLGRFEVYKVDDESIRIFEDIYAGKESIYCKTKKFEDIRNTFFHEETVHYDLNTEIKHLKINIANTCDLQCKYCYANHGNYGSEDGLMSVEKAKQICEGVKTNFKNIRTIAFFGGEPLLNPDAIEIICESFDGHDVQFLLQTNLMNLNDRLIELIRKNRIKVTVSIDGPKDINDINRVQRNGAGTYDIIAENIKKLNMVTHGVGAIQATYTLPAAEKYSKFDISKYLYNTFGVKHIVVECVSSDDLGLVVPKEKNSFDENYRENVRLLFNNLLEGDFNLVNELLTPLKTFFSKKYHDALCNASLESVTIDIEGNIWPCQMYINHSNFFMGNILDSKKKLNESNEFKQTRKIFANITKSKIAKCNTCISRYWCHGCLGAQLITNSKITDYCIDKNLNCEKKVKITTFVLKEFTKHIANGRLPIINKKLEEFSKW